MTREDIIRMAREVADKDKVDPYLNEFVVLTPEELERFAALAVAAEREACAKVCEERQEVFQKYYTKGLAAMCAEAIRARGNSETKKA
jgi:DNA-binding protein YbaB